MERLSSLDTVFLVIEGAHHQMSIGTAAIFDGPAPPFEGHVRIDATVLPSLPAGAKDHGDEAEDENEEVDPRHQEPPPSAVANLGGIMARHAGQFGEPTPFRNEKGAADRERDHDGADPCGRGEDVQAQQQLVHAHR